MLERPLQFVASSLDEFLKLKTKTTGNDSIVELTELVDDSGKLAIKQGKVGVTIINIEEERINRAQVPEAIRNNGDIAYVNPEIRLNLYLLFVANFNKYADSVRAISGVISYFQANNVFRPETHPGLDAEIQKIIFDLGTQTLEQLSYIWGFLGTSYRTSVVYKMRLVRIQEGLQRKSGAQVDATDYEMGAMN